MTTNNSVNTYIVPTTANEVTMPSQPAFMAYLGGNDNNVTGNGTAYRLGNNVALTEVFDQNADFDGSNFTAPVTGRYLLSGAVRTDSYVAATTTALIVNSSNGQYGSWLTGGINTDAAGNIMISGAGAFIDMDAADTVSLRITVTGEAGDVIDLVSNQRNTFFAGFLAV